MNTHDAPRPAGRPTWFDLMSPDVKGAAEFYAKVFGWDYEASGPEYGHYHMARVQGRAAAGIGQKPDDSEMPTVWTVYYAADDVDAMTGRAEKLGATVLSAPFEVPGQGRMAIVQDPTGAVFGLWQAGGHHGAGITDAHGAMTWCEVNTPDADAARDFYRELFGATAQSMDGLGTTYYTLHQGGTTVGGVLQMNEQWEGVPPHWMPYFQVADTDAAAKAAGEAGGKVSVPPFDTAFGRIAVLDDPFGAVFSVIQPPAGG